jgi:hypothetical protein
MADMETGALTAMHVALMSCLTTFLVRPGRIGLYLICAAWAGLDGTGALSLHLPVRLWLIGRVPEWFEKYWLAGIGGSTWIAGGSPALTIAGGSLGALIAAWLLTLVRQGFAARRARSYYLEGGRRS